MPYTLAILWFFFAIALLIGALFGWWLAKRYCECDDLVLRAELATLKIQNREHHDKVRALAGDLQGLQAKSAAELSAKVAHLEASAATTMEAQAAEASGMKARIAELETKDLRSAAHIIGRPVSRDDLTAVEGVGPKISELFVRAGITTWRQLAQTPTERMQEILATAGPSFATADPATWAQQASLLADGAWPEFKTLTDTLDGGRSV